MKRILITLAIILVLLSGCTFSAIKEKLPGQTVSGKEEFIGGPKGVETEIINPIEGGKAYLNMPFKVIVKTVNQGESESEGSTCVFSSFAGCGCQNFKLQGNRKIEKEKLAGEEETFTFEGGTIEKEEQKGSYFVTAKTRYNYMTYGIIQACVKKDAYSKEGCQMSPEKNILKSVSSAPITISDVKEEIIPETDETAKIIFKIDLKNAGKGDLYSMEEEKGQCETLSKDVKREIKVSLINSPGKSTCSPTELKEGKATTHCTVDSVQVSGESYEPEITIELEYAYETTDSNKFEVG